MSNEVTISTPPTGPDAPVAATNRPPEVPEKFWDTEKGVIRQDDLLKSYTELERQFHASRQGLDATGADGATVQDDPAGTAEVPSSPEAATQQDAQQQLESRGLDLSKYEAEFAEKRELSEASLAELEKAGIPKQTVDAYIAGQQAIAAQYDAQIYDTVGGESSYRSMIEWASQNLDKAEADLFDKAVTSGDPTQALMAVRGLHARYAADEGISPHLVQGKRTGSGRVSGYGNTAEMQRDMNDQRYLDGDPAFHRYVEQRLEATTTF